MLDATLYYAGRGGGKTHWLVEQIYTSMCSGEAVAVLNPTANILDHLEQRVIEAEIPLDLSKGGWAQGFTERTIDNSRGMRFDSIYIDNADLFEGNIIEMCAMVHPGVPITATVTPDTAHEAHERSSTWTMI